MSFAPLEGKIRPLHDNILVVDMEFDAEITKSGLYIPSQNGKTTGIKPRWGKVYAVGPEQKDVKVGEWIYVEHGRWTRGIELKDQEGNEFVIRRVDNNAVMLIADEKPSDVYIAA